MLDKFQSESNRILAVYRNRSIQDFHYSYFNPAQIFIVQERERAILKALRQAGWKDKLSEATILEIGCGSGVSLIDFLKWGAKPENLVGIDLIPERIGQAQKRLPSTIQLIADDAFRYDFGHRTFDLILQSTVFTSILDSHLRQLLAQKMMSLLRPGGTVLWYDFRFDNPRNPDVRGVRKQEIKSIFPGCVFVFRTLTLIPPILRALIPWSEGVCRFLSRFPFLCSHYLIRINRRQDDE